MVFRPRHLTITWTGPPPPNISLGAWRPFVRNECCCFDALQASGSFRFRRVTQSLDTRSPHPPQTPVACEELGQLVDGILLVVLPVPWVSARAARAANLGPVNAGPEALLNRKPRCIRVRTPR